ncbi:MAG: TetR/AcrR family transcriptional regulator [Bacteroidetes bacterium]|nr:TetR/AcrR family transcriptional regulator [Bacteroidota bacterium]
MTAQEHNREQIILDAARKVFMEKGFDGATMQDIADEAGINKSLLHYYYRSKDKLFRKVFLEMFKLFTPKFGEIFLSDKPIFEKIEDFAGHYIEMMIQNPQMPAFVLREITTNPQSLADAVLDTGVKPEFMVKAIKDEIDKGNIREIDPRQLLVNLIGLCIFPFAAKPLLMRVLFGGNENAYSKFLQERKSEVPKFINQSIKKK